MRPEENANSARLKEFIEFDLFTEPHASLLPHGWMSPFDMCVIYNAARRTTGDVLEVGPWLGRSSTALAAGLRDREEVDGKAPVLYDIIDFGITSPEEWFERFNQEFRIDHAEGKVAEAIFHPGGSNAVLVNNLKKLGLLKYTNTIMRGDLLKSPIRKKYHLIFCDALHSTEEVNRTMPKLATLLCSKGVLVADDVKNEARAEQVASFLNVKDYFFSRTTGRKNRRKVCVFRLG